MFLTISDIFKFIIVIICILSPYMFALDRESTPHLRRRLASRTRRHRGSESSTNPNQGGENLTDPNQDDESTPNLRRRLSSRARRNRGGESSINPNQGGENLANPNQDDESTPNLRRRLSSRGRRNRGGERSTYPNQAVQAFPSTEFYAGGESSTNMNEVLQAISTLNFYTDEESSTNLNEDDRGESNDRVESSTSYPIERCCLGWILTEAFSTDNEIYNRRVAQEIGGRTENEWNTLNIWPRGYALALLDRERQNYIRPDEFCLTLLQVESYVFPNITQVDMKTCPDWIYLSGYIGGNVYYNFEQANILKTRRLNDVLSDCAHGYGDYITRERDAYETFLIRTMRASYESPEQFCTFLGHRRGAEVSYTFCYIPPSDETQNG